MLSSAESQSKIYSISSNDMKIVIRYQLFVICQSALFGLSLLSIIATVHIVFS